MLKHLAAAAVATALIALPAAPSFAQAPATTEKKTTPQQQKMKDCAAKWGDYKKEKNVKGKAEHQKFMSGCLKGGSPS